jgi:putative Holliday junction resolvase
MFTLLGFDFGTKRIGVAVGQTQTRTATALTTLTSVRQKPDWDQITRLIREWQPDALVVGHPYEMTDREAEMAEPAKRFARQLEGRYRLRVHLVDERLTSRDAWTRLGVEAHRNRNRVDAMAAKLILETWLADHDAAD